MMKVGYNLNKGFKQRS